MNIDDTYKISIEMTARKQVEGLIATAESLLGRLGGKPVRPPDTENHIQSVIEQFEQDRDVFDSFRMTIESDRIIVRTSEGEMSYSIKHRIDKDDTHLALKLDCEEHGELIWNVTCIETHFFIDSVDGMSEYVFEKC